MGTNKIILNTRGGLKLFWNWSKLQDINIILNSSDNNMVSRDFREPEHQKIGQLCDPCVSVGQSLWYFPTQAEMKKFNAGMDSPFPVK